MAAGLGGAAGLAVLYALYLLHSLAWAYPFLSGAALFLAFAAGLGGRRFRLPAMRVGLYLFANAALSHGLKLLVDSPRPGGAGRGFPSAHACWAWGLAAAAALEVWRGEWRDRGARAWVLGLAGAAFLVSWSRVATRAHTWAQVAGGAAAGCLSAGLWELGSWASGEALERFACAAWDWGLGRARGAWERGRRALKLE